MPSWDVLHPFVVHFPIALLAIAPLFIFLAMVFKKNAHTLAVSALILMASGTIAAFVAVSTGEEAHSVAVQTDRTSNVEQEIIEHEEMAELTRVLFTAATLVYAGICLVPMVAKKRSKPMVMFVVQGVFLLAYLGCVGVLAKTAHLGGRVVHVYGVTANMQE